MTDRERALDALRRIDAIVAADLTPIVEKVPRWQHGIGWKHKRSAYGWMLYGLFALRSELDPSGSTRETRIRALDHEANGSEESS